MVLNGIKAIIFDLDNTLIDTAGASKQAIEEVMKILIDKEQYTEKDAHIICDRFQAKLLHENLDHSKMTIDDLRILHWEEALQSIRPGDHKEVAKVCYTLWKTSRLELMTLSESIKNMLIELRKQARLALLTNGERQVQREKIEACGASHFFDAIVVGGEHAEEKPAPSIFLHCCNLLAVKPEECVMVGDNLDTDIRGGLNAGLKATVWLNKNSSFSSNPYIVPHYTINSVVDLPDVLKNLK
ncbi:N-acylneuraminate-9-phosphatase [Spea bombifrons]|uniref:N-acylneuraminate-9-phosphatase n=1 Tax=Spea bombifrons TaxID=233779 RepID=UPI00234AC0F0|nr:N-acylneuraminate-9-phosphatase [Spea bombifrons]XP_053315424.1 N-acylneuraminate-9-phosphatase [Spea bombifrons]